MDDLEYNYDKPFLTFEEQIKFLNNEKNIYTPNYRKKEAIDILSVVPYHTLINGYKDLYSENDIFKEDTDLILLFVTHIIYTSINSIIFKYILHIENSLTAKLGYYVADSYGVETNINYVEDMKDLHRIRVSEDRSDYLCFHHYSGGGSMKILKRMSKSCRKPYNDTLIHHYTTTKNHLPPWILANDLSFGKTYDWYSILRAPIKNKIVNGFYSEKSTLNIEEKKELFQAAMKQLIQFRDRVAHSNKTVGLEMGKYLPVNPTLKLIDNKDILTKEEMEIGLGRNDLYSIILSVLLMLNNPTYSTTFVEELVNLFNQYSETKYLDDTLFEILNLPEDIEDRLTVLLFSHYEL